MIDKEPRRCRPILASPHLASFCERIIFIDSKVPPAIISPLISLQQPRLPTWVFNFSDEEDSHRSKPCGMPARPGHRISTFTKGEGFRPWRSAHVKNDKKKPVKDRWCRRGSCGTRCANQVANGRSGYIGAGCARTRS